ncbi:MAG: glycosyltransferase family 9 protein [Marinilabilia sp.]
MGKKILVFRFSAMGDVAMTVPVLWSFLQKYPDHEIWFVSRPFAAHLLAPLPRVHFIPLDVKDRHKGFAGLLRLFRELRNEGPWDAVADLHSVIRTHVLTALFKMAGVKVSRIEKGRKEKKALTRKNNKIFRPLPSIPALYRDTFSRAGFPFELLPFPERFYLPDETSPERQSPSSAFPEGFGEFSVGIAPFAKHTWKMWPEDKMFDLLEQLDQRGVKMVLFGAPGGEQEKLEEWAANLKNASTFAGQLSLGEELELMSRLNVMVSMDSANMHMATLAGIRVVSIWGATHPYAGFYGYGQAYDDAVQIDLECRPCSVFGNKTCHRGDFACMMNITPAMVLDKILKDQAE